MTKFPFERESYGLADGTSFVPEDQAVNRWEKIEVFSNEGLIYLVQTFVYETADFGFVSLVRVSYTEADKKNKWHEVIECKQLTLAEATQWFHATGKQKPPSLELSEQSELGTEAPKPSGAEAERSSVKTNQEKSLQTTHTDKDSPALNGTEVAILVVLGQLPPKSKIKLLELQPRLPKNEVRGATAIKRAAKRLEQTFDPPLICRPDGRNQGIQLTDSGRQTYNDFIRSEHPAVLRFGSTLRRPKSDP
ncbi:MAG: hypothetical protein RIG82_05750 [Phycisphaeraceae bacterium]